MIPAKVLAVRRLPQADPALCRGLGIPADLPCLAMVTCDSDDPLFIALDQATKAARVEVAFAGSFYAGAANATTPYAGEAIGILAGPDPGAVDSGLEAALACLEQVGFQDVGVPCLAHCVSCCGSFLAKEAGVSQGTALAYLIAPPLEAVFALDSALKAASVKLCKLYSPPSPTNFAGGLLAGSPAACQAACDAFFRGVGQVAQRPMGR